jgi:hypothetical protein
LEESADASANDGGPFGVLKLEADSAAQVSSFGYARANGNNNTTLGIFQRIEDYDSGSPQIASRPVTSPADHNGLREKYKNFIRQLPSKEFIEKLVATYFREVNYQYCPLDEGIFRDHLRNWNNLSFTTLNKGPLELSGDLQFFPALLFQMLALALQFQPPDYDPSLDSLKYAANMSFDDLASDYSDSGVAILSLLGKRHTTLITVQTGFLRTSFLKNCGMVPESWHSLSQTIRDAQEIGLHKPALDRPVVRAADTAEDVLEGLWIEQLRRRVWMTLSLWDIHMAIVLGRPTTIDSRDGKPVFPIDAATPKNRRAVAPNRRTDQDPPTPLTALLWTAELAAPLWDIYNLEKQDPHQLHILKVEKMHKMIGQIAFHTPPCFRTENPDTTFDSHPECYWLPKARSTFQNGAAFTIMALHRPYIFTHASSRTAALRACLDILTAQRTYFGLLYSKDYKMFSLVINTFDAIVVIAAVYILHPYENREHLTDALQHFEWGMERFQTMSARNTMAKAALGVLKAIHVRLKKALGSTTYKFPSVAPVPLQKTESTPSLTSETSPPAPTPESYTSYSSSTQYTPHSSISNAAAVKTPHQLAQPPAISQYTQPTISNLTAPTPAAPSPPPWDINNNALNNPYHISLQASLPQGFDFSAMPPLQPMHDLLYNDLSTIGDTQMLDPLLGMGGAGGAEWQFEGAFADDSFWGFMNSYQP